MIPEQFAINALSVVPIVIVVFVAAVLLSVVSSQRRQNTDNSTVSETIRRDSQWCEIVVEHDDGYGVALVGEDGGICLKAFNEADEVFQNVWLRPDDLEPLANALSVRAVEKGEVEGKWRTASNQGGNV